jgi:RNA polymerase sigma-70 factor (ECF subfamily)
MNDQDAISLLGEGNISGLADLVRKYQDSAIQAAYLVTSDADMAKDIAQAAFVRIYERIHQFDGARPFRPWLMRIVINDAIKASRRRNRQVSLDGEEPSLGDLLADESPGPAARMEEMEYRQAVRSALKRLSPEQRAAVVMRYFLEMTEDEMAENATLPRGTVKSRLYRARQQLRHLLRPLLDER